MSKSKVLLQIFPLVTDIDCLERTLVLLKQNSAYLDKEKFHIILDVTLPVSDYLTDWDNSILKQDFFINKFNSLKVYGDWADEVYFNIDDKVKGCVDCCINNVYKYQVDDVIWLDTDIMFNPYTLSTILESSLQIKQIQSKYIITPETTKLWDYTWDVIVNKNFLSKPYGYEKTNSSITDVMEVSGEMSIKALNTFKFAGAWFTLYSKELLDYIKFPQDIEGYSPIDTFIMEFCKLAPEVTQYKIENLVVSHDFKYTNRSLYSEYVKTLNRKNDLAEIGWGKFTNHIKNTFK
jgi:hypothetical protein